jgi:ArsR family transcriptional regulator, lead/cadmium/zinc/bismuth-responsive transcriptional repressor
MSQRLAEPIDAREAAAPGAEAAIAPPQLTAELSLLLAQTFQALADPTRARIMYALTRGEHSVSELAAIAQVSPSATSHHLRGLRDLRLVRYRRDGNRMYYTADDVHVGALFSEALHHLAHVVYDLPDHREATA